MAGFRGTFAIAWSQTSIDGLHGAPVGALEAGSIWRWQGEMARLDGPSDVLSLSDPSGEAELRQRAARVAKRVLRGVAREAWLPSDDGDDSPYMGQNFRLTDGRRAYDVMLVDLPASARPLLIFTDQVPPADTDLWVVSTLDALGTPALSAKVICFTRGTRLRTPRGPIAVEDLREGDRIDTRDDGAQPVEWIGHRRMSGARLHVMPELRPVRIRSGALGGRDPQGDLLISPRHRMLLRGALAQSLFNTPEVLVTGRDLVNGGSIQIDNSLRSVDYFHILLPRHQIVWANGVASESFHPAYTDMDAIPGDHRARLFARRPALHRDPAQYGDPVRRMLAPPEAAILLGTAHAAH